MKLTLTLADDKLPEVSAELADIDGSPEGVGAYLREMDALGPVVNLRLLLLHAKAHRINAAHLLPNPNCENLHGPPANPVEKAKLTRLRKQYERDHDA